MIRRPPRSTRTDTLLPATTLFRSEAAGSGKVRKLGGGLIGRFEAMYELGDPPDYEPDPGDSIAARAARAGRSVEEFVYDLIVAAQGRTLLYLPALNFPDRQPALSGKRWSVG